MEERTRAYLRGRFGDHYRRAAVEPPPQAGDREWGFVPWTEGPGETMVRHRSLLDFGDLEGFLERKRPKHVYFSAGRYEAPAASTMDDKDWLGSDLVFDLDADHLPSVDPSEASYAEMLAACKEALVRLLDLLERDFGFDDLTVTFSGGRGYHVHVRDESVQGLGSDARREIVDYVRGIGLELDALVREETVDGTAGRSSPATNRYLPTDGGWGARIHDRLLELADELAADDRDAAVERLTALDGIGEGKATAIHRILTDRYEEVERGNLSAHSALSRLAGHLQGETVAAEQAPIDEPVTTDVNRLIRLPGSLHGGSGLAVRRIAREDLADFDPLVDAVPETFRGHDIAVAVEESQTVELDGDSYMVEPPVDTVPECVGVFLMARGRAEKGAE